MTEIKEIKKSQNFDELLDLNDLMSNYKIYDHLKTNLKDYVDVYFKSFCKTKAEVLSYIPKSKHKEYQKYILHSGISLPEIEAMDLSEYLDETLKGSGKNDKLFIVDNIKKRIFPVLAGEQDFEIHIEKDELWVTRRYFKRGRNGSWEDGYITRSYIFDTNKNIVKTITGTWL